MWLIYFLLGTFLFYTFFSIYSSKKHKLLKERNHSLTVKMNDFFLFNVVTITILISSLRLPVSDTLIYNNFFNTISASDQYILEIYFEPGYQIFNKLISCICDNFIFYLFALNIIIWTFICIFLKKYSYNVIYSLWLFFLLGYFDQTFNLLRQYLAISIVLISYKYVINRKFIKFFLVLLIAISFHSSSIAFIIAYFVYKVRIRRNTNFWITYILICIACFYSSNLFFKLMELTPYAGYLTSSTWGVQEEVTKIAPILNYSILLLVILFCFLYGKKQNLLENSMLTLIIIASLFTILSFRFTPIGRVASYFSIFSVVLLANTIYHISNKKKKYFYYFFFFLLFLSRYLIVSYFRPDWASVYPYKFYFQ